VIDRASAFYEVDGRFAGYIGSCLDITDLRNAEQRIRFQASLLDQVRNAVIATDLEGKISYWNRYAEKLYGWKTSDALGRSVLDVVAPTQRWEEASAIRSALLKNGHWSGEFEVRRKDGRRFMAEVHDTLIADERGAPIGVVRVSADISARKRVQKRLQDSQEQLRALMVRTQQIKEEESTRIAREIHDELGQALSALGMDLNWMHLQLQAGRCTKREAELRRRLKGMNTRLETTVRAVQRIATELRPEMLDDFGLAATLEWQAEEFAARTGIACRWIQRPSATISDYGQATAFFRIFLEILTNVARHARARSVTLQLVQTRRELILEVADDGKGFKLGRLLGRAALGLLGMHERATRMGGRMKIDTAPGKGTRVTVIAPVRTAARRKNSDKG
jgi:PAS domain S-box-containing protein